MNPTAQLPLGVQLAATTSFASYRAGPNAAAQSAAVAAAEGGARGVYLHGPAGTGKSHLLQAACGAAAAAGRRSAYLPLPDLVTQPPALLEGLAAMDLLCFDSVSAVAGQRDWEEALVGLLDGLRARGGDMLAADRLPPADLRLALSDLRSRFGWFAVYALHEPDDADKRALLVARAAERGLELPDEVARFLLRHRGRDLPGLVATLERLDRASLAAQRRLTIPFVKQVLE